MTAPSLQSLLDRVDELERRNKKLAASAKRYREEAKHLRKWMQGWCQYLATRKKVVDIELPPIPIGKPKP